LDKNKYGFRLPLIQSILLVYLRAYCRQQNGTTEYAPGWQIGGNNGSWVDVPEISSIGQTSNTSVYSGSPWQSGSYGTNAPSGFGPAVNEKGLKILVLNAVDGGAGEGKGASLANLLKKLGFHCSRGFSITMKNYLKNDIKFIDESYIFSFYNTILNKF
jgi:hypothetical protein